ncbi:MULTISPECIES: hypothetical protein [Methylomonas]|uniref:hypothetical protein n=1 Tax=Methylomonas TaxID=416 RepID=UPI001232A22F|nr:hypothetical protein [Methylomonas rhizoryzae]
MNKLLFATGLLLAAGTVHAHSHPGIDSFSHALEHFALSQPAGWSDAHWIIPTVLAALLLAWQLRRPQ